MTLGRIFIADTKSGRWVPLVESQHSSENQIQSALDKSPELIPGDQISPDNPRRWLLVRPGVGDNGDGKQAQLLLDQDATPTFVVCRDKSIGDDHRQLVASMFDQVTQGTSGWMGDTLRHLAEETAIKAGRSLADDLGALIGPNNDAGAFWAAVDDKLGQRHLRLIFVDEEITSEFQQMLDFLNGTMSNVDVLAMEMKLYQAGSQIALVPRLVGNEKMATPQPIARTIASVEVKEPQPKITKPPEVTEEAQNKIEVPAPVPEPAPMPLEVPTNGHQQPEPLPDSRFAGNKNAKWNTKTFFGDLTDHSEDEQVLVGRQIFNWATKNTSRLEWGGGATRGAFAPIYKQGPRDCQLFVVTSNGWIELNLSGYKVHPPFNQYDKLDRFYEKLSAIEDLDIPAEALEKRVLLPLSLFTDPSKLAQFLKVFEWAIVNMEASTGELHTSEKTQIRRKPNISWPQTNGNSESVTQRPSNTDSFRSYENSFDQLLSRKRVELDDNGVDDLL